MHTRITQELGYLAAGLTPGFLNAPREFVRGNGATLYDRQGQAYLDFCSGTFTNCTGHCHPKIVKFMQNRVQELWNIHDYSSPYRLDALKLLDLITPKSINTFEFYSGGTETIEAGLRALYSYLPKGKRRFCSFRGGFHGKTLGSRNLIRWNYPGEWHKRDFQIAFPDRFGSEKKKSELESTCLEEARRLFDVHPQIGALIVEPILGAGGALQASNAYWHQLIELCRDREILVFADEICVGFGRTGADFSFQHYDFEPDLMAFAKGIGSGFPVMVLGGRKQIMNSHPFGAPGGASTTFGGNPLAIGAVYITIDTYLNENLVQCARNMESVIQAHLIRLKDKYSCIGDFRVKGAFASLQFVKKDLSPNDELGIEVHKACMQLGIKSFTFGHLFRIAPPLIMTLAELEEGLERLDRAIKIAVETVHVRI